MPGIFCKTPSGPNRGRNSRFSRCPCERKRNDGRTRAGSDGELTVLDSEQAHLEAVRARRGWRRISLALQQEYAP